MAKIIFEGIILKDTVKNINGTTFFRVSENIGTKTNPEYNYFDCAGKFSEKQLEYIKYGMIIEIVGSYSCKKNESDGKTYYNNNVYCYHVEFKGDTQAKKEKEDLPTN